MSSMGQHRRMKSLLVAFAIIQVPGGDAAAQAAFRRPQQVARVSETGPRALMPQPRRGVGCPDFGTMMIASTMATGFLAVPTAAIAATTADDGWRRARW